MRIRFLLISLVYLMFSLNYNLTQAAQINIKRWTSKLPNGMIIRIEGKIEKGDFENFKQVVEDNKRKNKWIIRVDLVSSGGDVIEAIKIGKLIRYYFIPTSAPHYFAGEPFCWGLSEEQHENGECNCASACFLIWAAGIDRKGDVLGLHRPYFSKEYFEGLSASEAQKKYVTMSNDVRIYLTNMGIPENIIERMFATGSDEIIYIDKGTVESINKVPFFDEWIKAGCKTLSKEENDERRNLGVKILWRDKRFSKSEKFYFDYLEEKFWKYRKCYFKKLMEAQREVKLLK